MRQAVRELTVLNVVFSQIPFSHCFNMLYMHLFKIYVLLFGDSVFVHITQCEKFHTRKY